MSPYRLIFWFAVLAAIVAAPSVTAEEKTFDLTAQRFFYNVSPGGAIIVNQGDVVTLRITAVESDSMGSGVTHGFRMSTYMSSGISIEPGTTKEVTFTAHTAGNFEYSCTVFCGGGHGGMDGTMVVVAAPEALSVTSISPTGGSIAGGTNVTITGTGFENGADVTFDGSAASNENVVNLSTITATTPSHVAGTVDVVVTNSDEESATLSSAYTFALAPAITGISPDSGPAAGGTAVTIDGSGFQSGASVRFASKAATGVSVSSSTITATTPSGSGTVDLTVTNPDQQSAILGEAFTYVPGPSIASISPNQGTVFGGTLVTIGGSGFKDGAVITFDALPASGVIVASDSAITSQTPPHSAGLVNVKVSNPDGQSATRNSGFRYVEGPAINTVFPQSGPAAGGTAVTISGGGFQSGATVAFDGLPSTNVVFVDAMTVTCLTPAHAAGVVDVTVTNPDQQTSTLENGFTFASFSIATIDPGSGPVTGGTEFVLAGAGFQEGAVVRFGSSTATEVVVQSSTTITGVTPLHPAGAVDVTVMNPDETEVVLEDGFTYSGVLRRRGTRRPQS